MIITRSRLVGKSLGYFPKDRVFESHLRYKVFCGLFLVFSFVFNTFAMSKRFRENPKQYFYNKRVPKGISNESAVNPFFERLDNPTGSLAFINFSIMSIEKKLSSTEQTNAQKLQLLHELLDADSAKNYIDFISNSFIDSMSELMKNYGLTERQVVDRLCFHQALIKFFYGLSCIEEKQSLQRKINQINKVSEL